jgi:hypothetical protein
MESPQSTRATRLPATHRPQFNARSRRSGPRNRPCVQGRASSGAHVSSADRDRRQCTQGRGDVDPGRRQGRLLTQRLGTLLQGCTHLAAPLLGRFEGEVQARNQRRPQARERCGGQPERRRSGDDQALHEGEHRDHRRDDRVGLVQDHPVGFLQRRPRRGLRRRHAADHHRRRGGDRVSGRRADGRRRLQPQRRRVRVRRRPAGAVPDLRELRGRALVDRCRNVRPAPARGVPCFAVVGRGADVRRRGRDRRAAPRTRSVPSLTPRHCLGSRGRVRSSSGSRSMPRSASAFASADRISNAAWA